MSNKTNRISSIPRTFGMALLGLALSTGAALAERPGDRSSGAQSPVDALGAPSENLRSGATVPLHSIPVETLGTSSTAMDAWAINCPSGTDHLAFDVKDYSSGGPTFGVLADDFNSGFAAMRRASQGAISSPSGTVNGGSGFYVIYVFKTGGSTASSGTYDSFQVCHTASHGVLNHLDHYIFQDQ